DGCHYHAFGYEILAKWISNLAKYDFYGEPLDFEAPQLMTVLFQSPSSLIIEFDKAITIQPELIKGEISYHLKDDAFSINHQKTTTISSLKINPKNPKQVRVKFSKPSISKGDILTYILDDNYPNTSIP